MATQKNATDETASEIKPSKIKVMLPRDPMVTGDGAEQEFFSVNGKNIIIKTDEIVEVDPEFAEVIENKAKARRSAQAFIKKMAFKDSKPAT